MTGIPETGKARREDGAEIAWARLAADPVRAAGNTLPGIVFCPGFRSDMEGGKAMELEAFCAARGQGCLRFDYTGHGASSGAFVDGTIGQWAEDTVFALDTLTEGPQVLVGSSMGGWIMLLAALARPERIAGLVGIAPAPDFTEDLMWEGGDAAFRKTLETDGVFYQPSDYDPEPTPITMKLIEEGRQRLLLRKQIPLTCPVRILQGYEDNIVPWTHSKRLLDRLTSKDVTYTLVAGGDHSLSRASDLELIESTILSIL